MKELKNLANVVIKKSVTSLKKKTSHDIVFLLCFFFNINYIIISVHIRYITIEAKEVVRIGYHGFFIPHSY